MCLPHAQFNRFLIVWLGVGEVPALATILGGSIIFLAITADGILNIVKPNPPADAGGSSGTGG